MEKKTKVLEVAKYIIEKTATVQMTADHFGVSPRTIQNYINKDLKDIDKDIYSKVKLVQNNLEEYGRLAGAKTGKRGPKYTDFETLEFAEIMIANQMTLDEASEYFKVPRSSIYDKVKQIDDEKLQEELLNLFEENKKRS